MAESQTIYNYTDCSGDLRNSLSEERFSPYLIKAGHNQTYAFNLYLYNARLSKSFLYPLHILEISLRNKISSIFTGEYGEDWPTDVDFRSILTSESESNLDAAIARSKTNQTADIIATLSFDFWSNLFRPEYDRSLWQTNMSELLQNTTKSRREFQIQIKDINKFRNRIAHYEPIHSMNISNIHTNILDTIGWLCSETEKWVKHHSTVNSTIRTSPSASGEPKPHFGERCDNNFEIVNGSTTLDAFPSKKFVLVENDEGEISYIIEGIHLSQFLRLQIDQDGKSLMIDLSDFSVFDLLSVLKIPSNFVSCGTSESLSKARSLLKKNTQYIVVKDQAKIVGIVAKAHRQY